MLLSCHSISHDSLIYLGKRGTVYDKTSETMDLPPFSSVACHLSIYHNCRVGLTRGFISDHGFSEVESIILFLSHIQ